MWQAIKNGLFILTRSSNDPAAMSLTVRGALVWAVAIIIQIAPVACTLGHVCIDTTQLNPLVDAITSFVKGGLELVAYGMMIVGIVRKIWLGRFVHPAAVQ